MPNPYTGPGWESWNVIVIRCASDAPKRFAIKSLVQKQVTRILFIFLIWFWTRWCICVAKGWNRTIHPALSIFQVLWVSTQCSAVLPRIPIKVVHVARVQSNWTGLILYPFSRHRNGIQYDVSTIIDVSIFVQAALWVNILIVNSPVCDNDGKHLHQSIEQDHLV